MIQQMLGQGSPINSTATFLYLVLNSPWGVPQVKSGPRCTVGLCWDAREEEGLEEIGGLETEVEV
jgi:hypothetical protein